MSDDRSFLYRDGTSQADRALPALAPEAALVDKREPADWLAFLRSYAANLKYYNLQNETGGDWSRFLEPVAEPARRAEIAAFLANPAEFADPRYDAWRRPHFALLLAFLGILRPVRDQLNTFTRRHLDFYYRDLLGFRPRPAGSGRVHVLIEPVAGQGPFLLPADTLLNAGRDPQGGEVHYQTDADLVVTPAQVRECRSLFLQRTVVGLADVRRNPELLLSFLPRTPAWQHEPSQSEKTFQALLEVALGEPNPGDPLPKYPFDPAQPTAAGTVVADKALFGELDRLLTFIRGVDGLALSLPAFRRLMVLRRGLLPSNASTAAQWARVNTTLQRAGRRKRNDPNYTLTPPRRPDDFVANLKTALNFNDEVYRTLYDTLPGVKDVYGLSRHLEDDEVGRFVREKLFFESTAEFAEMMAIVDGFYQQWQQISEILRGAGRRKQRQDTSHLVDPPNLRDADPNNDLWERLVQRTIGNFSAGQFPKVGGRQLTSLDDLDAEVGRLEQSFFMSADGFTTARTASASADTKPWEWDEVYTILTAARRAKESAKRRALLRQARQGTADARTGIDKMLVAALGEIDPKNPGDGLQLQDGRQFLSLRPDADADYIANQLFLTATEVRMLQKFSVPTGEVDWEKVASILDAARGQKEHWQPSALEFESWDNLFAAPDATAVRSAGSHAGAPRWRVFGDGSREDGATERRPFGLMIASPLLALAEGTRTVTLTLEFTKDSASRQDAAVRAEIAKPDKPFRSLLSTAKEPWEVAPADAEIIWTSGPVPSLRFVLHLREQVPPITPPASGTAPCLQILLRDINNQDHPGAPPKKRYAAFRPLVLAHARLEVAVAGLTSVLLQNDESVLDPKKPFEPFGHLPLAGSRFLFAHPEICAKRLDRLELDFDWLGLPPEGLAAWYKNYPAQVPPIENNRSFTARLRLFDDRSFWDLKDVPLFGDGSVSTIQPPAPGAAPASLVQVTLGEIKAKYPNYHPAPGVRIGEEPLASDRYWALELRRPDFLHAIYPQQAAQGATRGTFLNPPYTPRVRRLTLNYTASVDLNPADNGPAATDQLFYLEPFGYRYLKLDQGSSPDDLKPAAGFWLPQYELEGQLFIGIDRLTAPQNLSLLFQMAAGSADPDVAPEPVLWSYLSGDEWLDLDKGNLLSDTTRGLLNSGIVELDLPAANPNTLLPASLYWIRLAVARNSRSVCDAVGIHAQAVTASLAPDSAGASGVVLAPGAITALAPPRPPVRRGQQPYSPFAGSPPEEERRFATRVSERLRHKARALTCWDYERLVLEAFPEIYKVKCLPVDSSEDPRRPAVRVIVIPDIRGKQPFDPFEPKVPADVLRSIEELLASRCAAGATFRVQNPRFCSLKLRFSVRLRPGCNPGFYLPRLNEEVRRFLSPWAFDESADIVFGSRVSANLVVYFLEERPYVDYVTDLKLFLTMEGRLLESDSNNQVIDLARESAVAPDVIIVSADAHQIDPIFGERYVRTSFVGIDYMKVELDFSVA